MRALCALSLLAGLLLAEGEEPQKSKTDGHPANREVGPPGVKIEDPAVARDKLSRFEKDFRAEKDDFREAELVRDLGDWDHPLVQKRLDKLAKDSNRFAAIEAIFALARQSDAEGAGRRLHGLLLREKRGDVISALLVALGKLGYEKSSREAEKWFRRDTKETHRAAARYFGFLKSKEAFRMIAEKLDAPRPKNVDDPANPPAAWWEERHYEWEDNLPFYRWALSQIVPGETFETTKEAEQWAQNHGKEHEIEW